MLDLMIELERLDLNMLAVLCLRVLESGIANSGERAEGGRLRQEWVLLIDKKNPDLAGVTTQRDIEAHAEALRQRMVTYLAGFSSIEARGRAAGPQ